MGEKQKSGQSPDSIASSGDSRHPTAESRFNEYGWDWTYHAFREWDGWSVEHGSDPKDRDPAAEPTDRQRLLLGWFGKNRKP